MFKEMTLNKLKESYIEESTNNKSNIIPLNTNKGILALNTHLINQMPNVIINGLVSIVMPPLSTFLAISTIGTLQSQIFAIDFCGINKSRNELDNSLFNENVVAINSGIVEDVYDRIEDNDKQNALNPCGNYVIIKHDNSFYSLYAHLKKDSIKVKKGQKISQGTIIGKVGSSGNSTIPHLHFQTCLLNPSISAKTAGFGLTSAPTIFSNFYCQEIENNIISGSIGMSTNNIFKRTISNINDTKLKYKQNSTIPSIAYIKTTNDSLYDESKDKSEYSSSFKKKTGGSFKYIKFPSSEAERYMKKDIHWDKQSIDFFKDTKVGELIIDKEKDVIAGYIFVHKLKGVIGPLRIYNEYRGYGLSNTLVQDAINKFNGRELGVYTDNEVAVNLYHKHGFTNSETKKEKNGDEYMIMKLNESYIEEASSMDKKYRCPYCDNLYKRKDLPSHIEDKHEELIPKEMTPLQITFNAVNNKTRGTCTECGGESPWNESKGRYDRICTKKSCHDSYVKKMKSRMVNKYGREHNLNDAKVQEKMLKNRKISGTYVWSDRTQFSYCGSYEKSLLEFLDKVLCCKSEDIMTPGPVVDYTYKGEQHQWITDLYYIPYNLCFDVKDGGKNPNNRPMEEYRQKQDAKERAIKEQGKYNYIRLTDNDFSQLFEIFFELKMQLVDNDTNKIVRINEYSSATINALPVMGQEKGDYIIQYMDKNTFTRGYGYCSSNELIDDIHIIDIYGKENIVQRDEFINMVENYTIFKYNGDIVEETNEYDNTYPIDYYYTKLTGRRLIDDRQIFIDKDFTIESKLEDKLEALKEVYTSSLLNDTNILESDIGFDKDGMYMYNKEVGLRTKSYNSLEEINKDEIKIIGL